MKTLLARTLLLSGVLPLMAGTQVLLRNFEPADGVPEVLAADSHGHLFVVSTLSSDGQQISRVVGLDLNGSRIASLDIPQLDPAAAICDAQGNVVVVGQSSTLQGTVWKLDSQLRSAVLLQTLSASVRAVALDSSGNIFLTGNTSSASFPLTADAYQSAPPVGDNFGTPGFAFLTKISPGGEKVLYSTYFGSSITNCDGGSFCIGKWGQTTGTTIAVDTSGAVVIAGSTTASGLPITSGAFETTCICGYSYSFGTGFTAGFIARFQPGAATQLQWSTFLNGSYGPISTTVNGMAIDAAGNVIVVGSGPPGLPETASALEPAPSRFAGAFLVKLNSTGAGVVWGTYFGNGPGGAQSVLMDLQGQVIFSGYAATVPNPNLLTSYVARLSGDGSKVIDSYAGPPVYYLAGPALAITSAGGFAAVYPSGALWIETAASGPSLLVVANSASGQYANTVTGSELVTLYGVQIGPQMPVNGQVQSGAFTTSLGGCQVLFDGVPAPLLYADPGQINAVAPRTVGPSTHIQVITPAGPIDGPTLPAPGTPVPGVFQTSQAAAIAAALNQDGSLNSASNPAKAGSVVTIFATGAGPSSFADGAIVPIGIFNTPTAVSVTISRQPLEVVFAGDAPGLVAGVMQVNFLLPDPLPAVGRVGGAIGFTLMVDGVSASFSQIYVVP